MLLRLGETVCRFLEGGMVNKIHFLRNDWRNARALVKRLRGFSSAARKISWTNAGRYTPSGSSPITLINPERRVRTSRPKARSLRCRVARPLRVRVAIATEYHTQYGLSTHGGE